MDGERRQEDKDVKEMPRKYRVKEDNGSEIKRRNKGDNERIRSRAKEEMERENNR